MYVLGIISIIFFVALMFLIPVFAQWKLFEIETDYFKRVKIKKFSFMFRGILGASVSEYGVIIPMFIVQICGYILAILSSITAMVLYFVFNIDLLFVAKIIAIILGVDVISTVITMSITMMISRKRKKATNNVYDKFKPKN